MKIPSTSRFLALLTVSALTATALLQPATAHADKAKTYKYGAIALGALGAYMLSKGKTVEGAAVLGAGAYVYKKGEDTRKAEKDDYDRYGNRYDYSNGDRYTRNPIYPDARDDTRYRDRDRYNNYGSNDRQRTTVNGNTNNSNSTYRARRDRDDRYRNNVRVR